MARCFAKTSGLRCGNTKTPVMSRSRDVSAPTKVNQASGSGRGASIPPAIRPDSE
ncbi:MAG: hypothetical protein OXT01_08095 [Rhodospirillaceae bacterium]|nr:hypothetical protein [Rhodospirillaceae bacterium]